MPHNMKLAIILVDTVLTHGCSVLDSVNVYKITLWIDHFRDKYVSGSLTRTMALDMVL